MIIIHPKDIKKISIQKGIVTEIKFKRKYKDRGFEGKAINIENNLKTK